MRNFLQLIYRFIGEIFSSQFIPIIISFTDVITLILVNMNTHSYPQGNVTVIDEHYYVNV